MLKQPLLIIIYDMQKICRASTNCLTTHLACECTCWSNTHVASSKSLPRMCMPWDLSLFCDCPCVMWQCDLISDKYFWLAFITIWIYLIVSVDLSGKKSVSKMLKLALSCCMQCLSLKSQVAFLKHYMMINNLSSIYAYYHTSLDDLWPLSRPQDHCLLIQWNKWFQHPKSQWSDEDEILYAYNNIKSVHILYISFSAGFDSGEIMFIIFEIYWKPRLRYLTFSKTMILHFFKLCILYCNIPRVLQVQYNVVFTHGK